MLFLKILLIVIASSYVLGWLGRLWLRSYMKKMQKRMEEMQRGGPGGYERKREGEIKVEIKDKKGKKFTKDQGDYVDYEEVND